MQREPLPEHVYLPAAARQQAETDRSGQDPAKHTHRKRDLYELTRLNASFRCGYDLLAPGSLWTFPAAETKR